MEPPSKKRKLADTRKSTKATSVKEFEQTLKTAIAENSSLNALVDLLAVASKSTNDPELLHKALYANFRIFSLLITSKRLEVSKSLPANEVQVRRWLQQKLDAYLDLLNKCAFYEDDAIKSAALKILFSIAKQTASSLSTTSGHPQLHLRYFRQATNPLLSTTTLCEPFVRDLVCEEWLFKYDDVRYFILREILWNIKTAEGTPSEALISNCLSTLEKVDGMPSKAADLNTFFIEEFASSSKDDGSKGGKDEAQDEMDDDWTKFFDEEAHDESNPVSKADRPSALPTAKALHSVTAHKVMFSQAWYAVLQSIKGSKDLSKRVLNILHHSILPHMLRPERLMDWIGACVDFGGSIALLALNALFLMIREHNLDYPDFYERLYAIVDPKILHVRYRARFFRLLDVFLSSTHLPVTLLASFVKKLSRLSLHAPPAAIVIIMPFAYNILKRHPALMVMIHREEVVENNDPFLPGEQSPLHTNAIESSLWELQTHRNHYVATISAFAKIFSEPFTKPSHVLENFLDHTYSTMYSTEARKKITKEPAMADTLDSRQLFDGTDVADRVITQWRWT